MRGGFVGLVQVWVRHQAWHGFVDKPVPVGVAQPALVQGAIPCEAVLPNPDQHKTSRQCLPSERASLVRSLHLPMGAGAGSDTP